MSLPADWSTAIVLAFASTGLATITQALIPVRFQMGPLSCGYCMSIWYGIAAGLAAGMLEYQPLMCASTPCLAALVALGLIHFMPQAFSE